MAKANRADDISGQKPRTRDFPKTLLLAGSARSGSSILYRLLASHERVEAQYEPRPLYDLVGYIDQIEGKPFKYLWDSYLRFEVGAQNLAGRALNLNEADVSSAHFFITRTEIERRLAQSIGEKELLQNLNDITLLVKLVGVVPKIAALQRVVELNWVWIGRHPAAILASLMSKGWFSDEMVFSGQFPATFYGNLPGPFWLDTQHVENFFSRSELDRCVLYITAMQNLESAPGADLMVDYSRLCNKPANVLSAIEARLKLKTGPMTEHVVESLSPPRTHSLEDFDLDVRQKASLKEDWERWKEQEASFY